MGGGRLRGEKEEGRGEEKVEEQQRWRCGGVEVGREKRRAGQEGKLMRGVFPKGKLLESGGAPRSGGGGSVAPGSPERKDVGMKFTTNPKQMRMSCLLSFIFNKTKNGRNVIN